MIRSFPLEVFDTDILPDLSKSYRPSEIKFKVMIDSRSYTEFIPVPNLRIDMLLTS